MCNELFITYPIRNKYEYYLPEFRLFNSDHIGRLNIMDINIFTEPSYYDCHSEDHRFNTFHCNNVSDANLAWLIGLELVNLLRGLSTVFYGEDTQRFVYLEKMKVSDESIEFPRHNIGVDANIPPNLYVKLGENLMENLNFAERKKYRENAKRNIFSSSLYLAQTNIGLYLILKYFSEPLTWVNLYKIMETFDTLEAHHDVEWKRTYSNGKKKKFTNPANDFSMIGIVARHGFKKESLEPNVGPKMELGEAKEMFIECAKSYLRFKMDELRKAL